MISAGDGVALSRGQFVTVSSTSEMLALRSEVRDALRGQIQSLIRSYNTKNLLAGSDQKRYPFICGSETESVFLEDLLRLHARIVAGAAYDDPGALLDVRHPRIPGGAARYGERTWWRGRSRKLRRGGDYQPTQLALISDDMRYGCD